MNKKFFEKLSAKAQILILVGILVFVNLLAGKFYFRLDLTQHKKFSIAKATKQVVQDLDDILIVKTYFSPALPTDLQNGISFVQDSLKEFASISHGKIRLKNEDTTNETVKGQALQNGIPQISVTVREKDELKAQNVFLGMGLFYHDKKEIFPVLTAKEIANLEYDFAIALKKLTQETQSKKKLGFVANHSSWQEDELSGLKKELEKIYQVSTAVDLENAQDLDGLLIFSPQEAFSESEKFTLEQKILAGVPVMFFLDRLPNVTKAGENPNLTPMENGLDDLLQHFGLKLSQELVADVSMDRLAYSQGFMRVVTSYPLFPLVTANSGGLNLQHPITSSLSQVSLKWPAHLEIENPDGLKSEVLLASTAKSSTIKTPFNIDPAGVRGGDNFAKRNFAVLTTGKVESCKFCHNQALQAGVEDVLQSGDNVKILTVANSHFLHPNFLDPSGNEGKFLLNAVDFLVLDENLISIRSKANFSRPLDKLLDENGDIPQNAKLAAKFFNLAFVPLVVLAFGVWIHFKRKR